MSTAWKILIPLLIVLPLGGYVAGSLATVGEQDPPPHTPIVLRDDDSTSPGRPDPSGPIGTRTPDDDSEPGDDDDDDGDAEVITPKPFEDDDDDDRGDDGDDNSGPGGGGDDSERGDDDGEDGGDD